MRILLKRIYEPPLESDGKRILVERLWPRGFSKEQAAIDFWSRETAPSAALRSWFNHEPARWDEFRRRYFEDLDRNPEAVSVLLRECAGGPASFVFASRETTMNNAVALRDYLRQNHYSVL